ncbi:hypothetical protein SERLA73DRAFT_69116 [Serpula lacrymans var. lacrymans S7.3]|uniref:Uncharacterized protein n=1 Tax=Serpula lacrymans var. lacrymans (strain S7.3) TaxID=936435 RepID=F8PJK9_SERL3|nr:hypothetical protein SERLA73DRAFT_69116 [Serpula lacrymans var. lacrymans S7.3]
MTFRCQADTSDLLLKSETKPEQLEHLHPITLALFQGTLNKWESFTTEYAPGGTIDQASTEERDAAWMPATNDANKGALGTHIEKVYIQEHVPMVQ